MVAHLDGPRRERHSHIQPAAIAIAQIEDRIAGAHLVPRFRDGHDADGRIDRIVHIVAPGWRAVGCLR